MQTVLFALIVRLVVLFTALKSIEVPPTPMSLTGAKFKNGFAALAIENGTRFLSTCIVPGAMAVLRLSTIKFIRRAHDYTRIKLASMA